MGLRLTPEILEGVLVVSPQEAFKIQSEEGILHCRLHPHDGLLPKQAVEF
jgi:hypothetical protein